MTTARTLTSGIAGTAAVTLLFEAARRTLPDAPRLDLLGVNAVASLYRATGRRSPGGARLVKTALAGDLIANTAYYGITAVTGGKKALITGSLLGAAAGLGAAFLPGPLGLGRGLSRASGKMTALTVALYAAGGLAAGAVAASWKKPR